MKQVRIPLSDHSNESDPKCQKSDHKDSRYELSSKSVYTAIIARVIKDDYLFRINALACDF